MPLSVDNKENNGNDENKGDHDETDGPPAKGTRCRSSAVIITEGGVTLLRQVGQLGGVVGITPLGNSKLTGEGVPGEAAKLTSWRVLGKTETLPN